MSKTSKSSKIPKCRFKDYVRCVHAIAYQLSRLDLTGLDIWDTILDACAEVDIREYPKLEGFAITRGAMGRDVELRLSALLAKATITFEVWRLLARDDHRSAGLREAAPWN